MTRFALLGAALLAMAVVPAAAQTAQPSGSGSNPANTGGLVPGNGFPAGSSSVGASGGGGGASNTTGTGGTSRTRAGAGRGGGSGGFVLSPPSGASGEAAFLLGTDLSCAPQ